MREDGAIDPDPRPWARTPSSVRAGLVACVLVAALGAAYLVFERLPVRHVCQPLSAATLAAVPFRPPLVRPASGVIAEVDGRSVIRVTYQGEPRVTVVYEAAPRTAPVVFVPSSARLRCRGE